MTKNEQLRYRIIRGPCLGLVPFPENGAVTTLDVDSTSAIFCQVGIDGSFEAEHLETLKRLGKKRPLVMLAFPPKAAGTFLRSAIIYAIDGEIVRVVHAQGGRDAQPYLPTFINYFNGGLTDGPLVAHVHMLALPANLHFLEAFGIRPIIMKRSIPDMLASYWDMIESDAVALKDGLNCHIPENFPLLPDAAKADFLIDILAPWYVNYYAGWLRYAETNPDAICVLDYRDFLDDPAGTLSQALDHVHLPRTPAECMTAINLAWSRRSEFRFNKGEEGRGGHYFEAAHLARLTRLLGHYPSLAPHAEELLDTGLEWQATVNE